MTATDEPVNGSRPPAVLRLSRLHPRVTALGPGTRLGIWVQGCGLACPGCMARDTWNPRAGVPVTVPSLLTIWAGALAAGADGLTVSGGEPLDQPAALGAFLAGAARARDVVRPEADLLVYTGYGTGRAQREVRGPLRYVDAVVTGRFLADRPTQLVWRGSANQELVPLTARGRQRYQAHWERVTDRADLQIVPERDGTLGLIGVPRAGDLAVLDATLRSLHVDVRATTWHG